MGIFLIGGCQLVDSGYALQAVIHLILVEYLVIEASAEIERQVEAFVGEGVAPGHFPFWSTVADIGSVRFAGVASAYGFCSFFTTFVNHDISVFIDTCITVSVE